MELSGKKNNSISAKGMAPTPFCDTEMSSKASIIQKSVLCFPGTSITKSIQLVAFKANSSLLSEHIGPEQV